MLLLGPLLLLLLLILDVVALGGGRLLRRDIELASTDWSVSIAEGVARLQKARVHRLILSSDWGGLRWTQLVAPLAVGGVTARGLGSTDARHMGR